MGAANSNPGSRRARDLGQRGQRARRSHSMPGSAAIDRRKIEPSKSKAKALTSKGKTIYAAVRHKLMANPEQSPRVLTGEKTPNLRIPAGLKGKAARDHAKMFRELVSGWSAQDLHCLLVEYEASAAVRQLTWRADAARHHAPTLREDLSKLYASGCGVDSVLVFNEQRFPVHSAILKMRSAYFRKLYAKVKDLKEPIHVGLPAPLGDMSAETFGFLIEYLYTGEVVPALRNEIELILKLKDHFGTPHTLDYDVYSLLKDAPESGDATLVFVSRTLSSMDPQCSSFDPDLEFEDSNCAQSSQTSSCTNGQQPASNYCEFRCHSLVLAARSPFFRSLIQKRLAEKSPDDQQPITIMLDESVIPRIYAPVLLHALYTDQVDLAMVIRGYPISVNSLSEVQAIAAGKCQVSPIDEATEIYQIARFLEFEHLAQGCEDIIVEHINVDCLSSVYNWSVESYGSPFVRRHCVNFLCQEFSKVANSALLFDLEESLLIETLRSDFVQASELELLQCVVRWGEHQLVRRMEEREPNILAGTTHSISRKGVRRADLSDDELRDILANLTPLLRPAYILPPYHHSLVQATSRGLVSFAPPDLPGTSDASLSGTDSDQSSGAPRPDGHWLHPHSTGKQIQHTPVTRPRVFEPYVCSARSQLLKRLHECPEQSSQLLSHHPVTHSHQYPDALYMVRPHSPQYEIDSESDEEELPLPELELIESIESQVSALMRSSATVQKALSCGCMHHRKAVLKQLRLRVLREFGLSDHLLRVLRHPRRYYGRPRSQHSCRTPPESRRFRSEPELVDNSQSEAVGGAEAWPDLMCGVERFSGSCTSLEIGEQQHSRSISLLSDLDMAPSSSADAADWRGHWELRSLAREIEQLANGWEDGDSNTGNGTNPPDLVDN